MLTFECFYLVLISLIATYGVHRYWLVAGAWRAQRADSPVAPAAGEDSRRPSVLVQLPIYNEPRHFTRLIDSAVALDWPRDRLTIQVLDDSTDGSSADVAAQVERWRAAGLAIEHRHREDRVGFKAGALALGLAASDAELVAIFDADFIIPRDFLERAVPEFDDPDVGMVQGRWAFINDTRSWLTRVQALMLDGHFHVEHRARAAAGRFFNFNGTAGVWRAAAIHDSGGWLAETVTEDLELSLRAWLRGWRFRYRDDLEVPSELPEGMAAYKIQQNRWVSGSIHTAVCHLGTVMRSSLGPLQKLDLFFYLTGNLNYLLMLILVISIPQAILLRFSTGHDLLWADVPFFLLATVSVYAFYSRARRPRSRRLSCWLLKIPALMALGLGMTLHNARAVLRGAFGRSRVFERTPKQGGGEPAVQSVTKRDVVVWLEGLMACYVATAAVFSIHNGGLVSLPFLLLFVAGYGYVFVESRRARIG